MNKAKSIILAIVLVIQLCVPGAFLVADIFDDYSDGNEYIMKIYDIYVESNRNRSQLSISFDMEYLALGENKYLPLKKDENGFAIPTQTTSTKPDGDYVKSIPLNNLYHRVDVTSNSKINDAEKIRELLNSCYTTTDDGYEYYGLDNVYATVIFHRNYLIPKNLIVNGEKVCDFVLP